MNINFTVRRIDVHFGYSQIKRSRLVDDRCYNGKPCAIFLHEARVACHMTDSDMPGKTRMATVIF